MIRSVALLLGLTLAVACGGDEVVVRVERASSGAEVLSVRVELALTADERARGLRGRGPLAADEGLLIELPRATEVCIVNDGVDIAIDAVYAGADGAVVAVERGIPAGDGAARCRDATWRVLEVAAGVAADVAAGDQLVLEP